MKRLMIGGALLFGSCSSSHAVPAEDVAPRSVLDSTRTPVLILPGAYMRSAIASAEQSWYGLSFNGDNINLYLHGTTAIYDLPEEFDESAAQPNATVRGNPAWMAENEGVQSVTWEENGAAYSLELECADLPNDERCRDESFVVRVANEVEVRR